LQTTALLFIATWLISVAILLWRARHSHGFFDLGVVGLIIFGGYYLLPSMVALSDALPVTALDKDSVDLIMQYCIVFIGVFTLAYLIAKEVLLKIHVPLPGARTCRPDDWKLALAAFLGLQLLYMGISLAYINPFASYTVTYAQAQAMPQGIVQIYELVGSVASIAEIVLLWSLKEKQSFMQRRVIVGFLIFHLLQVLITQARAPLIRYIIVLIFLGNLTPYWPRVMPFLRHLVRRRRRVPIIVQLLGMALLLVALNVFGAYRGSREGSGSIAWGWELLVPSEFIQVYLNSYILAGYRLNNSMPPVPGLPYVSDIFSVVPSYLAPWQKVDLATWYVKTLFPWLAQRGGGQAFGTVAEALVLFGFTSIVIQAAALGIIWGGTTGILLRSGRNLPRWFACFYLFQVVWIQIPMRATTFSVIGSSLRGFFLAYLISWMIMRQLRAAANGDHGVPVSADSASEREIC